MIRSCTAASFFSVDYYIFSPKNVTLTLSRITTVGVTFRRHYFLLRFFFSGDEETLGHHLEKTRVSVCFSSRLSKAWKTSILSINKCLETDTWYYSKWPKMLKQVKNGKRWFCQISKNGAFPGASRVNGCIHPKSDTVVNRWPEEVKGADELSFRNHLSSHKFCFWKDKYCWKWVYWHLVEFVMVSDLGGLTSIDFLMDK